MNPADSQPGADPFSHLRHDLRTPINQILGYSEMLEEEAVESQPGFVPDLKKIQKAARNMLDVIQARLTPGAAGAGAVAATAAAPAPAAELVAATAATPDAGDRKSVV